MHAHFYQPPREDPFIGGIPVEDGAAPYLNWNERIFSECYLPNIEQKNFERISFNVGPTLFSWMADQHPQTVAQIIEQDRRNVARYGVGNAMAQAYNHTILPLAQRRDKITQIKWGCADFRHRFSRNPKGMWLPETAFDLETIEILVENGIEYIILAPWQAGEVIEPNEVYRVNLGGQSSLAVFFFNQELSSSISFDPLTTTNADLFVSERLVPVLERSKTSVNEERNVVLIATDGELYGHHQTFRNFFLQRLVDGALSKYPIQISFPEKWLKENQVKETIKLNENTSWSCHHGLQRWLGLCNCVQDNGKWKKNLWVAFDNLANNLDDLYIEELSSLTSNPWEVRDRYIHVILGEMKLEQFLGEISKENLTKEQKYRATKLLEAQRERQRMFTSCGWFFDKFDRIESRNNLAYAAQAINLTHLATGIDLSQNMIRDLSCSGEDSDLDKKIVDVFLWQLHRAKGSTVKKPTTVRPK